MISFSSYIFPFTRKKALIWLSIIGFIIYANMLLNGFAWDDLVFIINNPEMHHGNLSFLFGKNMFNSGPFYRPLPAIYFAFSYYLFENHAFYYHFIQLLLHLLGTSMLFLLFSLFFSEGLAFFLALIFLVHPINVESVAYIGSTQSELYFIPGIAALLLATKYHLSPKRFIVISALLVITLFTKETGFLFMLLVILFRYLFKLNSVKNFSLLTAAIVLFYAGIRVFVGGVTFKMSTLIPIASLSLGQRLVHIPAISLHYITTVLFPWHLASWQIWILPKITFLNFVIPLVVTSSLFLLGIGIAWALFKNKSVAISKKEKVQKYAEKVIDFRNVDAFSLYVFFFVWTFLGMGIILQIVPLDMTVADRWFYFPFVGILGMIGIGIKQLHTRYAGLRKTVLLVVCVLVVLLSIRTIIRNADWKDEITLFTHDLKLEPDNYYMMITLAKDYAKMGEYKKAVYYQENVIKRYVDIAGLNELGTLYQQTKQYNKAIAAFSRAVALSENKATQDKDKNKIAPYANVAYTYLLNKLPEEAISFLSSHGIKKFPKNANLYTMLAIAESQIGDHEKALVAIKRARSLSNDAKIYSVYLQIKNNSSISVSGN